jgi:hypothetical protein
MESRSRTRGWLYHCHEALRNYPLDCACTPLREATIADSLLIRSILETVRTRQRGRVWHGCVCSDILLTEIISFPPGVINTIPSLGPVGGAALAAHKGVDKVAFTGSTVTGRKVLAAAATSNLKKVSLELGGKSPHIIFESANIEQGLARNTFEPNG